MMNAKTIKMIGNKRFEVTLFELKNGAYSIGVFNRFDAGSEQSFSKEISDLILAGILFDAMVLELEGQ